MVVGVGAVLRPSPGAPRRPRPSPPRASARPPAGRNLWTRDRRLRRLRADRRPGGEGLHVHADRPREGPGMRRGPRGVPSTWKMVRLAGARGLARTSRGRLRLPHPRSGGLAGAPHGSPVRTARGPRSDRATLGPVPDAQHLAAHHHEDPEPKERTGEPGHATRPARCRRRRRHRDPEALDEPRPVVPRFQHEGPARGCDRARHQGHPPQVTGDDRETDIDTHPGAEHGLRVVRPVLSAC